MLINTNSTDFTSRDVLTLKFMNGEEILASFVSREGSKITVAKPVIMQLVPAGNGQAAVQFAPFMLGVAEDCQIVIDESKLMVEPIKARSDAASQYMKATTSIELVGGGL
jgi:hypothetical protein